MSGSSPKTPSPSGRRLPAPVSLSNGESRFQTLLQHLPVGVYRTTPSGRIIEANQALADILGFKRVSDLVKLDVKKLYVRKKSRREHMERLASALTDFTEFELRRPDGKTLWVRDHPRAVKDENGRVRYYDGILDDVSERHKAQEDLERSEQDYRRLFEHAHDAIIVFSVKEEIILDVNNRACELYGFTLREMLGMSMAELSKDVARGKARIRKTLADETCRNFETVHYRKDGSEMVLDVNAAPVVYKGRPAILSINRDITRRRQMETTIREMAYRDSLTGLPNRTLFNDRLVQALAYAKRHSHGVTLLYLDLDGFKPVNDLYGHQVGDELLRQIGNRLSGLLRESDTVARLGGDEFLILLPDAGKIREGNRLETRIRAEIGRPFRIGSRTISITASVGMAICPRDGKGAKTLMKRADSAMYAAKKRRDSRPQASPISSGRKKSKKPV